MLKRWQLRGVFMDNGDVTYSRSHYWTKWSAENAARRRERYRWRTGMYDVEYEAVRFADHHDDASPGYS